MLEKVAIVTVIYSDPIDQFRDFINSLKKIKKPDFELILVNNDSRIDWLESETKSFPSVKIIESGKNLGFCAGSNLGVRLALKNGANRIILLNGDTSVLPNILQSLLKYQSENPKAGVITPIIISADKDHQIYYAGGIINKILGFTRNRYFGRKFNGQKIKSGKTDSASGCCMLVTKEVFEKIGLLDENYFMYFDDPDFSLRAQKLGFEVHLLALPLVCHLKSSNKLSTSAAYYYGRNPFIMIWKNFRWYFKPTAYIGQFIIRLPRNVFRLKDFSAFGYYLAGVYDGVRGK